VAEDSTMRCDAASVDDRLPLFQGKVVSSLSRLEVSKYPRSYFELIVIYVLYFVHFKLSAKITTTITQGGAILHS